MYWLGTHVISDSLNVDHTTVGQTICINIDLSEVVGIVTLLQSLHAHFSCVQGSPCTWCPNIHRQYLAIWNYFLAHQRWGTPRDILNCDISSFAWINNEAGEQVLQGNVWWGCIFFCSVASLGFCISTRPPFYFTAPFYFIRFIYRSDSFFCDLVSLFGSSTHINFIYYNFVYSLFMVATGLSPCFLIPFLDFIRVNITFMASLCMSCIKYFFFSQCW